MCPDRFTSHHAEIASPLFSFVSIVFIFWAVFSDIFTALQTQRLRYFSHSLFFMRLG